MGGEGEERFGTGAEAIGKKRNKVYVEVWKGGRLQKKRKEHKGEKKRKILWKKCRRPH